jgi:hypothetical protein
VVCFGSNPSEGDRSALRAFAMAQDDDLMRYDGKTRLKTRQTLALVPDDGVADYMVLHGGSELLARAEFLRRQIALQREASEAAKESAQAAKDTATYTKRNARYMLWSVVILAISSTITAVIAIVSHSL